MKIEPILKSFDKDWIFIMYCLRTLNKKEWSEKSNTHSNKVKVIHLDIGNSRKEQHLENIYQGLCTLCQDLRFICWIIRHPCLVSLVRISTRIGAVTRNTEKTFTVYVIGSQFLLPGTPFLIWQLYSIKSLKTLIRPFVLRSWLA